MFHQLIVLFFSFPEPTEIVGPVSIIASIQLADEYRIHTMSISTPPSESVHSPQALTDPSFFPRRLNRTPTEAPKGLQELQVNEARLEAQETLVFLVTLALPDPCLTLVAHFSFCIWAMYRLVICT